MSGIADTAPALAELLEIARERAELSAAGEAPAGMLERNANLRRAIQIVELAGMITYFEASDTGQVSGLAVA